MDFTDPMAGGGHGGGVEVNPHNNNNNNTEQKLFNGLDVGFKSVMDKLAEIQQQMKFLPEQTSEALSGQLQNGISVKTREEKRPDVTDTDNVVNELMTENQTERSQLEERIQQANWKIEAGAIRETELNKQLLEFKRDIARRELKEVQFRDIIISNAATQQITDQDVVQAFSELRQTVQQLAKNQAFDLAQIPLSQTSDTKNQAKKHFYAVIRGKSPKDVSYRVRMQIWEILLRNVFGRAIFGLKSRYIREEDTKDMWEIEKQLANFDECLMKDAKVSNKLITDWRVCTLQCISAMEIPERHSEYVAEEIEECFKPLVSRSATKAQKEELWVKMVDVCRKAVALKLMMQRSKEGYKITTINIKEHPYHSELGHLAESMGVEGGKALDASDDIAYVLFGALTKCPTSTGAGSKVLVKAEVILKKE